jgi:hypothetical protein
VSEIHPRPRLYLYILTSFTISFLLARIVTSIKPDLRLISSGYHIPHFWLGLAMLAIGGWIGINYTGERIDRLSAIIFGAGGGLVGDEVGLLLTLGNYDATITYTIVVGFLILTSGLILVNRFRTEITEEIAQAVKNRVFLSFTLAFTIILVGFLLESTNLLVTELALALILLLIILLLLHFLLSRIITYPKMTN